MSTEFDWFMVTMPIFAIVVYAIVMVGSMEKQPKFLESKQTENMVIWAFGALFAWEQSMQVGRWATAFGSWLPVIEFMPIFEFICQDCSKESEIPRPFFRIGELSSASFLWIAPIDKIFVGLFCNYLEVASLS